MSISSVVALMAKMIVTLGASTLKNNWYDQLKAMTSDGNCESIVTLMPVCGYRISGLISGSIHGSCLA